MNQQEAEPPPCETEFSGPLKSEEADTANLASEREEEAAPELEVLSKTETETENQAASEVEGDLSQAIALALRAQESVHRLEEVVRNLKHTQHHRFEEVEGQIHACEGALLGQIAELESRVQQEVQENTAHTVRNLASLVSRIEAVESARREAEERAVAAEARAAAKQERQDAFQQAWKSAPLTLRLRFVRELLPEEHALQTVLKEAAALEELRRRGHDLETWIHTYPSLFADAAQALESGVTDCTDNVRAESAHAADSVAEQTLLDARSALDATLQALGILWIAPEAGDAVTAEHEVIGEEPSSLAEGTIAQLRRRGFRIQGRLALPAQVMRSVRPVPAAAAQRFSEPSESADITVKPQPSAIRNDGGDSVASTAGHPSGGDLPGNELPVRESPPANRPADATSIAPMPAWVREVTRPDASREGDLPGWLRILSQRTFGCDLPAVVSLTKQVTALNSLPAQVTSETADDTARKVITDALQPLLPLLGLRYADGLPDIPQTWGTVFLEVRDPLLAWLDERMHVQLVSPTRGARFDSLTMETVETRRTVHANENGTVAKVERIGLLWHDHPVARAQVVLYTTEGNL